MKFESKKQKEKEICFGDVFRSLDSGLIEKIKIRVSIWFNFRNDFKIEIWEGTFNIFVAFAYSEGDVELCQRKCKNNF